MHRILATWHYTILLYDKLLNNIVHTHACMYNMIGEGTDLVRREYHGHIDTLSCNIENMGEGQARPVITQNKEVKI